MSTAHEEAQEVLRRVLAGIEAPPAPPRNRPPRKPQKSPTGLKRGENLRNHGPSVDRAKILELFHEKKRVSEIAKIMGCHRTTVSAALDAAGIPPSQRQGPGVLKEYCGSGRHLMAKFGKNLPKGGRFCTECKRERQRAAWHKNKK